MLTSRLVAGLVAAVGLIGTAGSAAAYQAVTVNEVNVRSGPAASYPIVGMLAAGTRITVDDCHMDWCMIESSGQAGGWVSSRLIESTKLKPTPYFYGNDDDDDDDDDDDEQDGVRSSRPDEPPHPRLMTKPGSDWGTSPGQQPPSDPREPIASSPIGVPSPALPEHEPPVTGWADRRAEHAGLPGESG